MFLQNDGSGMYTGDGSVDSKGRPALKNKTGQWKACSFVLGDILFSTLLTIIYPSNVFC